MCRGTQDLLFRLCYRGHGAYGQIVEGQNFKVYQMVICLNMPYVSYLIQASYKQYLVLCSYITSKFRVSMTYCQAQLQLQVQLQLEVT